MAKTIPTRWEVYMFTVSGGNAYDGWQTSREWLCGVVDLRLNMDTYVPGSAPEEEIFPTPCQCARVFGVGCRVDPFYDGPVVNVYRASDNYPIGTLRLIEPEDLYSPGWLESHYSFW